MYILRNKFPNLNLGYHHQIKKTSQNPLSSSGHIYMKFPPSHIFCKKGPFRALRQTHSRFHNQTKVKVFFPIHTEGDLKKKYERNNFNHTNWYRLLNRRSAAATGAGVAAGGDV